MRIPFQRDEPAEDVSIDIQNQTQSVWMTIGGTTEFSRSEIIPADSPRKGKCEMMNEVREGQLHSATENFEMVHQKRKASCTLHRISMQLRDAR
jgi:hypothetical protein